MDNFTLVILAIVTACATFLTIFVMPLLKKNISAKTMHAIQTWTDVAVRAAEQLYGPGNGPIKKDYVEAFLKDRGIHLDPVTLDILIETAVLELNLAQKMSER